MLKKKSVYDCIILHNLLISLKYYRNFQFAYNTNVTVQTVQLIDPNGLYVNAL
jgi:hypothetical protein